jgi:hypothetical protein
MRHPFITFFIYTQEYGFVADSEHVTAVLRITDNYQNINEMLQDIRNLRMLRK